MYAIAFGNPFDGLAIYGPFETQSEAEDYADTGNDPWVITELHKPESTTKPYTAVAVVPDHVADNYGQDTWLVKVRAENTVDALAKVDERIAEILLADEWEDDEEGATAVARDFRITALLEGHPRVMASNGDLSEI